MVAYSFKKRFVAPIMVGLGKHVAHEPGDAHVYYPKRQTIRAEGKRRHARPGEVLQLYTAMRTKQCRLIGTAICREVLPIRIVVKQHSMPTSLNGEHIGGGRLRDFARMDGFENAEDMHEFWRKEHGLGPFHGFLIRWEPISQSQLEAADD